MKSTQIYALSASAALAVLLLGSCKGKNQQQGEGAPPELAVMTVSEESTTLNSSFPATLRGENDVEIRPQIQGILTRVCVQEGQHVNKGQVLFEIDQVTLQAAVDAAAAAVQVAQAQVNTATTNANNNKILLDKNIIGAPAYQTSVDQLNQAKAQLHQAKAQLTSARKNLSYSVITSPTSGVVGTIDNKEGSYVTPQTLLTIVSNNSDMEAMFSFNEKDVLQMTDNGSRSLQAALQAMPEVTLQLANGTIYPEKGKIVSVSGVINSATGSASVKAIFPNKDGMLHSGNTGEILIPQTNANAIQIPQKATYEVQDMKFVYVVDKDNMLHSVPVQISQLNDGQNYIVTSGLEPGQTIVIEGVGVTAKDSIVIKPRKLANQ